MGERDDAGVAEQQIVAGHQHDEDQDLRRDVKRLRAGKNEGRERQSKQDRQQDGQQHAAARQVVGQQARDHRLVTGKRPCGRHSRIDAISRMLENSATFGARKPV